MDRTPIQQMLKLLKISNNNDELLIRENLDGLTLDIHGESILFPIGEDCYTLRQTIDKLTSSQYIKQDNAIFVKGLDIYRITSFGAASFKAIQF